MNTSPDTLQKFLFENADIRGELVELEATWQQIITRRSYPPAVQTVLGQMLAAAALLSANLKFDGAIILQIHGDGPVRLLVVECDSHLQLRATAKIAPDVALPESAALSGLVNLHGKGRFVITLDPGKDKPGRQAYQGVVPLDGDDLATVIENYMLRSEQLDTKLWLAADGNIARGLLLQKLPDEGGIRLQQKAEIETEDHLETWNRVVMLASTLSEQEMLSTDIRTLMQRLFWEETVRVFQPQHPRFHCTCTREKVGNMLKMLGQDEINSALAELGNLNVNCEFCGLAYQFDSVDCAQLFAADTTADGMAAAGSSKH